MSTRRVTTNISLTLDGRYHGAAGPSDLGAIVTYASTDTARDYLGGIHAGATTAVLGRTNAEGFLGYWPSVAADENADPRDRAYAQWLVDVDKVVLSRTLTESPWERTRVVNAPATEVITELKSSGTGDILVNSSPTIVADLLAADLIDRLHLMIVPEIAGGGAPFFTDGLPASRWTLSSHTAGASGELALVYDRAR